MPALWAAKIRVCAAIKARPGGRNLPPGCFSHGRRADLPDFLVGTVAFFRKAW